jgi:dihydrolipoamide dehydrogenase
MNKMKKCDVAIIGAGPGGYAAAFRAADLGKQVVLIEKDSVLGGVCLNRGCIPSKALLHISRVIHEAKSLEESGIKFPEPKINLETIRKWKESIISKLNNGISLLAQNRNITIINGNAKFISNSELIINTKKGDQTLNFKYCIIATGSSPSLIPNIPHSPKIINSTGALNLKEIPKRLLIIGGGYIGLEMGSVYHALGSKITVVEFMQNLLPGADSDLVKPLAQKLKKSFNKIYLSTKVSNIKESDQELLVQFEGENNKSFTESFDSVLVSIGRKPNTKSLDLENAGITPNKKGYIKVNNKRQTENPCIFAIGDITGDPMLAHKATHEGKVAAEVISGLPSVFEPTIIPAVIFTDPEIAWAGPTENELKEKNIPYEKGEFPWSASGKALALNRIEGKTKLIFDPHSKKIIAAGIVGPNAGDLIGEAVLAIEMGADVEDISLSIHPHPTLTETFSNAAEMFNGTITDLYIPKKS